MTASAAAPTPTGIGVALSDPSDGSAFAAPSADVPSAGLWERIRSDPQYTPEHLALEAVRRLGPEAHAWVQRTREERPGIGPDALAHLAARKFVCYAALSGALSGAAGLPGAIVDVGLLATIQARMVLHIAAAHGHDPRHVDRTIDLLVLQRVHPLAESARLALGVMSGRQSVAALLGRRTTPLAEVAARVTVKVTRLAGVRVAKRMATRYVPGAAIVFGAWANTSATIGLARRASDRYAAAGCGRTG
jgi:EcsC protein family